MTKNMKVSKEPLSLAVLSWIHVLLLAGGLYLLLAGISGMTPKQAARFLCGCLWLMIPIVLSWIFIRRIRALPAYLLCSAAATALIWFLSSSVLTTGLTAAIFLLRCCVRIKRGRITRAMRETTGDTAARLSVELWEIPTFLDRPHPAHWAAFCVYYLALLFMRQYFMLYWVFLLLAAELFVCFIYNYLDRMWTFIRENRKIANLPVSSIQKVGRVLLALAVCLLALVVLPSALYGREPLINVIENFHPKPLTAAELEELFPENDSAQAGMDLSALPKDLREPPAWLTFLSDTLLYLFSVLCVGLILVAIYRLCRSAAQYFSQEEDDEIVFLAAETRTGLNQNRLPGRRHGERWTSPNKKIRRLYKKALRRSPSFSPLGFETPEELEQKAALESSGSTALHELYEKARYSQEKCTAEDVGKVYDSFKVMK